MSSFSIEQLVTTRTVLEPLTVEHADEMVAVLADAEMYTFTGGEPPDLSTLRGRYGRQVAGPPADEHERWLNWVIRRGDDHRVVGLVQATVLDDRRAEVAWMVGVDHQGNGYAVEAATAMATWLRAHGATILVAHIHPEHFASHTVATAIGLTPSGHRDDGDEEIWTDTTVTDRTFAELAPTELLAVLRLRAEVFVIEQECVYLDIDGRDDEATTRHLWIGAGPSAYLRLLDDGSERRIGRVVTRPDERGSGHAATLVDHVLATSVGPWMLDAQEHLRPWYERFGFEVTGPAFDEDGIMHVPMRRSV